MRKGSVLLSGVFLLCSSPGANPASPTPFKVIVSPTVPGKSITRQVLGEIFLRRVVKWSDGRPIKPVDLSLTSPVRIAFSRTVLGFTALDLQQYWRQEISKGNVPPPAKQSEEDVIAFVGSNPGAIGYVSEGTQTPDTVKVLEIK